MLVVQLLKQFGRYGDAIQSAKLQNFVDVTERGSHYNSFEGEHLKVVVNVFNSNNAWILGRGVVFGRSIFYVPVENAPDKRRNKRHLGVSTSNRLSQPKYQRKIAVDSTFSLQVLCRLDTLIKD